MISRKQRITFLRYFVIIIISLAFLIPFAWMLVSSLKDPVHVYETPVNWFPEKLHWENYIKLFTQYRFQDYVWNTVKLCALNVLGTTISCTMVAYGFAFGRWKHKNKLFMLVLATMMLPGTVIFFPQFILFVKLHMYGTLLPLWLTSFFANAYGVFFLRQFFLTIPDELIRTARLDGCNDFRMIIHVIMPMARPVYIVMLVNTFINVWGDFFNQLIYITRSTDTTVMIGLTMLNSSYGETSNAYLPSLMGGSFIVSVPILLIYYIGQKRLMDSYTSRDVTK